MYLTRTKSPITDLNSSPEWGATSYPELEKSIAWSMDEVYKLAQTSKDDNLKMRIVALEYRARLLLERWKRVGVN